MKGTLSRGPKGRDSSLTKGAGRRGRTRGERRRAKYLSICRTVAVGVLVVMLFLLVMALDSPPERNAAAETAATVAAAQEYERVLELYGDRITAMEASNQRYMEIMEKWDK